MPGFISNRLSSIGPVLRLISKKEAVSFGILAVCVSITEAVGFSMLLPILTYVEDGGAAFDAEQLPTFMRRMLTVAGAIGIPLTLVGLLSMAFIPMILRQVLNFGRVFFSARVVERVTARLRNQGFSAFIVSDLQFHSQQRQGALLSALTIEAHRAGSVAAGIMNLVATMFMVVIYVGLLLAISPLMTLIALTTAVTALLIVGQTILPVSRKTGQQVTNNYDDFYASIVEELSAVRLIKMRGLEQSAANRVAKFADIARGARLKGVMLSGSVNLAVEPVFLLGLFGMLYFGGEFLGVSLATLGVLMVILLRTMPLANQLNASRQSIALESASLVNLQRLIEEAYEAHKMTSGTVAFNGLKHEIEFDNVSFSYYDEGEEPWALKDVSFTIPKGSMTALVGRSGAGKSTLVDLIPRLRDANMGTVRMDGVAIKELDLTSLRRSVGYLNQETFLFNDTIYNNIAYGVENPTRERVEAAAKRAYAHDFIMETPMGYDTEVGDRGVRLSVGQRQRLGIAQVMLQNPDIIILDEPTSALDSESEYLIGQGLDEIRSEKTLIVIAHRLSTIRQADQIIVLEDGRLTEQGNHQNLLEQEGGYSRLFDLQIHA
jgi:subfamily B ATP-binding cassette protein MsbA